MSALRQTEHYRDLIRNSRNQGQRVDRLQEDVGSENPCYLKSKEIEELFDKGITTGADEAIKEFRILCQDSGGYEFDYWDADYFEIEMLLLQGEFDQAESMAGQKFYQLLGREGKNEGGETVIFRSELITHKFELLLARIEIIQEKYKSALARFEEIYDQMVVSMGSNDIYSIEALEGIAESYLMLGDLEKAVLYGEEAKSCYSEKYGYDKPPTLKATNSYARYLLASGDWVEAKKYNRIAVNEWKRNGKQDYVAARESFLTEEEINKAELLSKEASTSV